MIFESKIKIGKIEENVIIDRIGRESYENLKKDNLLNLIFSELLKKDLDIKTEKDFFENTYSLKLYIETKKSKNEKLKRIQEILESQEFENISKEAKENLLIQIIDLD